MDAKNNEKKPTPLVIRIREAKERIIANLNAVVREEDLPYYLIEPMFAEIHSEVSKMANREYEQAVAEQHAAMQEKKGADPE